MTNPNIVYYSGATEMTKAFINKLEIPAQRIPLAKKDGNITVDEDYVLIVPTYGAGKESYESKKNAVHRQIVAFLNIEQNRKHCIAVVGAGNSNFGHYYIEGAKVIAGKLQVPLINHFELMGTESEVASVKSSILDNWDALIKRELEANVVFKKKD